MAEIDSTTAGPDTRAAQPDHLSMIGFGAPD